MLGSNQSGDVIISPQSGRPRLDNRNIDERPRSSPDLRLSAREINMELHVCHAWKWTQPECLLIIRLTVQMSTNKHDYKSYVGEYDTGREVLGR
jgi:hypothetical protein